MVSNLLKVTELRSGGPALNLGSFSSLKPWIFHYTLTKLMRLKDES